MKPITNRILKQESYFLYIHTPFCGTCHIAKSMLLQIEAAHEQQFFYEMNASFFPQFMQEARVESVPCLLIKSDGEIKEKVYAFKSIPNLYSYLLKYNKEAFLEDK